MRGRAEHKRGMEKVKARRGSSENRALNVLRAAQRCLFLFSVCCAFCLLFCSISSLKEKRAEQKDWRWKINEGLIEEVEENMAV